MSPRSQSHPFYGRGDAERSRALLAAMSVEGLDEEIALARVHLAEHLSAEPPDEGLVLAWINALARTMLAKARIEGAGPAKTSRQMAGVIRELGSIFLEEPPQ